MSGDYVELQGSYRPAPEEVSGPRAAARAVDAVKPTDTIEVSVYLKSREDDSLLNIGPLSAEQAASQSSGKLASRENLRADRADAHADDIAKVVEFANNMGLTVVKTDPARRLIKLAGPADKLEAAFRTKLHYYNNGTVAFRARSGSLSAPKDVADVIESVLGLDTRPQAQPRLTHHAEPHAIGGHLPNEVAKLYNFPNTPGMGKGQCIAIIELGGGYRTSDNKKAFKAMGLKVPTIVPVSVSGGLNQPGVDSGADGEVALDIQVAGGAAPGATLAVYFAPNTTQGFVDELREPFTMTCTAHR